MSEIISVTGRTRRQWTSERRAKARTRAARLGHVERVAAKVAERAAIGAVRAAQSPVATVGLTVAFAAVGSLTDIRL